ncbi:histone deacetylase 6 isoform X2 [Photinus pyralis]|uniref:histone deacetylase 6 isoform X2 n=1 Tax=Photinus pyralis TaxID=7054 RepID=UPI001266F801|nr:histone deacetylase 6 isoform X2 [Photinus pyralis]
MENESKVDEGEESTEGASELDMEKRRMESECGPSTSRSKRYRSKLSEFISSNRGQQQPAEDVILVDVYEKAEDAQYLIRKPTGIVFDDLTSLHRCEWDPNYIEHPGRFQAIMDRLKVADVLDRCKRLSYTFPSNEDLLEVHTQEMIDKLRAISLSKEEEWEDQAACYDSVYFNESTFTSSMIAAGCAISLVDAVCNGEVQNGMAIVRPPGHHAMSDNFCGFCNFNNVAIAAKYALGKKLANKILIVDIDVHHGQATQQTFYNSNNVLYFSIHRYEHGAFWPNLRESNFDYIGEGAGKGYNINFPLNAHGLDDSSYMAIVLQILLPVAYEFNPDLILVSAGYDAAIGDSKGEMMVSPAFYGHLLTLLSGLALGRMVVCLEGGYFLPSLAEGVLMTVKALLGDACAYLNCMEKPHHVVVETINDLRSVLGRYWKCFRMYSTCPSSEDVHKVTAKFVGVPPVPPYETRNCYPLLSPILNQFYNDTIEKLRDEYELVGDNRLVGCCFHREMLLHKPVEPHYENPGRLSAICDIYKAWMLHTRCVNVKPRELNVNALRAVHGERYIEELVSERFGNIIQSHRDMYYNEHTLDAIKKANACLLTLVDYMVRGIFRSGVALIRPPGHHAEPHSAMGFCFVNNVAVAAKELLKDCNRVAIVDFDIHHGNGTQNVFYNDDRVLYISIHKFFPESFFPNTPEGDSTYYGEGRGKGYNVNVALRGHNMHDVDYMTIFFSVILPILYSYNPQFILVSAGFDAGINDPLGKYKLSPECFGHFIQILKPLAKGRIILVLEGGYNRSTVKYSMNLCIKSLLGDPLPSLDCSKRIDPECMKAIAKVKSIHKSFWPILDVDKKVECDPNENKDKEPNTGKLKLRSMKS